MHGKLTSTVQYWMRYEIDNTPITISFGLGTDVTVNLIIDLPTLHQWGGVLNFTENIFIDPKLNWQFPLHYEPTKQGLPPSVQFGKESFVRPLMMGCHSGHVLLSNISDGTSKSPKDTTITPSSYGPTVTYSSTGDCFKREVLLSPFK